MIDRIRNFKMPSYGSQVWILFAGTIVATIGSNMVMPFLSIYMYGQMNVSMTMIGLAFFISTVTGAIASFVGGSFADKIGRKPLLIGGLILQVVAYILIGAALSLNAAYWILVAVLSVAFFIDGLYRPIPEIMIADIIEPERRVEVYGLIRVGFNLGVVVGPVLGGILALVYMSYSSMFIIAAVGTAGYLILALLMLKDTKPKEAAEALRLTDIIDVAMDKPFLMFALLNCLLIIPYSQMYTLLSVYSSAYLGFNTVEIGGIFAISGLMVAMFQFPISAVIKRYRMTSMLALCSVIFAIGFGMIWGITGVVMVYVSMAIITIAEMLWAPASSALQANMSPESRRGRYFGFGNLTGALGFAIGPLFGGLLKDGMGENVPAMWLVIAGMFIISMAGFLLLGKVIPRTANKPVETKVAVIEEAEIAA